MKYRKFGKMDWEASILGLGCMRLPTTEEYLANSPNIDEREATDLLHYAIDHGVNYLDTGQMYHMGESENFLGRALKGARRDKVKLATKMWADYVEGSDDFDRLFETQLRKLQTEHIDLYLLHGLNGKTWHKLRDLDILSWLEGKVAAGHIGHIGFSFHGTYDDMVEIVEAYDGWEMCMVQYNYMDVEVQGGMKGVQYAASKGLGVVIMEPLQGGNLAAAPGPVKPIWDAAEANRTPVEWALDWLWDQPEVTVVLSGMSSMEQLKENIGYVEAAEAGMLTDQEQELYARAREEFTELRPVPCTQCGYCMPCPEGVFIPGNLGLINAHAQFGLLRARREAYNRMFANIGVVKMFEKDARAVNCTGCRQCEGKCPQGIPISEWMPKVHAAFGDDQSPA